MSEYEQLEQTFLQNGWTSRQGRGDHIYFRHPSSKIELKVSKSVSPYHNVNNIIAKARRIDPSFIFNRRGYTPPKQKLPSITQVIEEIQSAVTQKQSIMQNPTSLPSLPKRFPKSRKDGRMFKWVKPGITVRYSAFCNWDYSDIENPEAPINHPYIIESITPEGKLIIKDGKGETRIEVFANDVDTMESDICRTCHKRFPVSFMYSPSKFNPRRCYDCIHEERQLEKETSDMTKTKTPEDIITDELIRLGESTDDDTIKNIINMVHFDIEGRDVLGRYCLVVKLINDIPDFLAEKICLQIEEHLSPSLKEKGIGIKVGYHYFIKTEDKPALENPVKEVELPETAPVEVEPQKSIEDLVNILRETADKLRSMGVKVKIRKIKYTEKKEITVFKKVKHTFKI